jgi:hypothetical protein
MADLGLLLTIFIVEIMIVVGLCICIDSSDKSSDRPSRSMKKCYKLIESFILKCVLFTDTNNSDHHYRHGNQLNVTNPHVRYTLTALLSSNNTIPLNTTQHAQNLDNSTPPPSYDECIGISIGFGPNENDKE